jgi:hypothetical protein
MGDLTCTGDYGCVAERHIEGCYATDRSTYGRQTRLAALLAVARDHARLTRYINEATRLLELDRPGPAYAALLTALAEPKSPLSAEAGDSARHAGTRFS